MKPHLWCFIMFNVSLQVPACSTKIVLSCVNVYFFCGEGVVEGHQGVRYCKSHFFLPSGGGKHHHSGTGMSDFSCSTLVLVLFKNMYIYIYIYKHINTTFCKHKCHHPSNVCDTLLWHSSVAFWVHFTCFYSSQIKSANKHCKFFLNHKSWFIYIIVTHWQWGVPVFIFPRKYLMYLRVRIHIQLFYVAQVCCP